MNAREWLDSQTALISNRRLSPHHDPDAINALEDAVAALRTVFDKCDELDSTGNPIAKAVAAGFRAVIDANLGGKS